MKSFILSLVLFTSAAMAGGFDGAGGRQPAPPPAPSCPKALTVTEVLSNQNPVENSTVIVRGEVANIGTSYETNQRFVLKDGASFVDIETWLPLSVAPGMNQPRVMSDVLGKTVVVRAVYKLRAVRGAGAVGVLTEIREFKNCH